MPPARSRANPANDDSRSDTSVGGGSREKASTAEKRRQALGAAAAAGLASEKSLLAPATTNANGTHAHEGIEGVSQLLFNLSPFSIVSS